MEVTFPSKENVSATNIVSFLNAVNQNRTQDYELHSFLMLRHGKVIVDCSWHPYNANGRHSVYSLSKLFISTAIGMAVDEKRLSVDDNVLKLLNIVHTPQMDEKLAQVTVKHLLTMSFGHEASLNGQLLAAKEPWLDLILSAPLQYAPGERFVYDCSSTYLLSLILQTLTGETATVYLTPRLFAPLGIESPVWDQSPQKVDIGAFGLHLTTLDIAKLGQFYLQKGVWNGKRLLSEEWIAQATSYQTATNSASLNPDWQQGYGYKFWLCTHECFRGDGAFGQFCLVLPKEDAVIAVTAACKDMQKTLDLIWENILPAFDRGCAEEDDMLICKNLELSHPPLKDISQSPLFNKGIAAIPPDNSMGIQRLTISSEGYTRKVCMEIAGSTQSIVCGIGSWEYSTIHLRGCDYLCAASCGIVDEQHIRAVFRLVDTPYTAYLQCSIEADALQVEVNTNVSFSPFVDPFQPVSFSARYEILCCTTL